ncbi:MAG: NAD(P)H-hydrate dehydratase [Firmicutes bacterium]|nr:NAD(P)H-hydrate dehydratase [Bacillota bacterium]
MQVVTGAEMQVIEKKAFAEIGISPLVVMENAGSRIVQVLKEEYGPLMGKRIHFLAGTGNNGGDGLVVARMLLTLGARIKVHLVGNQQKLSKENKTNLQILRNLGVDVQTVDAKQLGKLRFSLGLADLIIDAIFGTGFSGRLEEQLETIVSVVNEMKCPTVSIDCPTGVNATTGEVGSVAFRANLTVNLGFLKTGCVLYPGKAYAGENIVVDLGFPLRHEGHRFLLGDKHLSWLPIREPWSHKGTFGHTLVIAGSPTYAGAAYLSSHAILRGGGGMVTLAVPQGIYNRFSPDEVIVTPVSQTTAGTIGVPSLQELLALMQGKDVLAIGPGLTREPEVVQVVQELLRKWDGPAVIDADALGALDAEFLQTIPEDKRSRWILTPHPGEMARLVGRQAPDVNAHRLEVAQDFSQKWNVVVLLKGAPTIVSGLEATYINSSGNHGMATAGSGDVLTGLIAALVSQGFDPLKAAALGAYVHGRAGDVAGQKGRRGLQASDILERIQEILQ